MKLKFHIALIMFVTSFCCDGISQQTSLVSHTHFNLFNENLAFAGNYEATHFSAEYFKLWNINGAPEQYSFSAHTPIKSKKLGAGILVNRTQIGAREELLGKLALSYKLPLAKGLLSFGLAAGALQYNFDRTQLNPLDPNDQLLAQNFNNSWVLNFDFGMMYTDNRNYLGVEIDQINTSEWKISEADSSAQVPHFKAAAGHVFVLKNSNSIRLSAHARTDLNLTVQTDVLASYFYQNKVWFGAGVRLGYGVLANLEINFTKRLHAGYSASIPVFTNSTLMSQSHSVYLGFMLPTSSKRAPSIRNF